MERMVNRHLQYNLEKNGLLSPSQSGFRKNSSTEDQVTLLTQDIENGFQQKMKTLAVSVDFTTAFDRVWTEGFLFKLLRKRVCSNIYSWIQSYLFQRSARVRLEIQKISENHGRSPTRWSHLTHSLHKSLFSLMTSVTRCPPTGAACRRPSVLDQSRASDHRSHQDTGNNGRNNYPNIVNILLLRCYKYQYYS